MAVLLVGGEADALEAVAEAMRGAETVHVATSAAAVRAVVDSARVVILAFDLPSAEREEVARLAIDADCALHAQGASSPDFASFAHEVVGSAPVPAPPVVQGLGGAFLYADDPDVLAEWYGAHFGLEFQRWGDSRGVELPSRDVVPADRAATTTLAFLKSEAPLPIGRTGRVNLRVADLDALVLRLRAAGLEVEVSEDDSYGRFAWVGDPEGNRLELWEPPLEEG